MNCDLSRPFRHILLNPNVTLVTKDEYLGVVTGVHPFITINL